MLSRRFVRFKATSPTMISRMKYLVGLVLILLLAAGGAWVVAGRMTPPAITIEKPEKFVGTATPLQITITAPDAPAMKPIRIVFEQNGKQTTLFSLDEPGKAQIAQDGTDKVRITHEIGKQTVPDLQSGAAKIIVTAGRPGDARAAHARGERQPRRSGPARAAAGLGRLDPPLHQSRRHGVRRLSRDAGRRRVGRGRRRRRVSRLSGGGRRPSTASRSPIPRCASRSSRCSTTRTSTRRCASSRATRPATPRAPTSTIARFPKPFKKSRFQLDDKLLDRVVPAILEGTTEVKPDGDNLAKFLVINGELRRKNAEKIASFAKQTSPEMLWRGVVFHPFTQQRRRIGLRRPPHLHLQGQGSRPAGPPRLRPRVARRHPDRRGQSRQGALRRRARHLRQLRDHRPRDGRAVALRAPVVDRSQGRAGRRKEQPLGRSGMTRARRRRSPALHDARQRPDGEPGRVVGLALDRGPDPAQAQDVGRHS